MDEQQAIIDSKLNEGAKTFWDEQFLHVLRQIALGVFAVDQSDRGDIDTITHDLLIESEWIFVNVDHYELTKQGWNILKSVHPIPDAADELGIFEYRLLGHYQRVCGWDNQPCTESASITARRISMAIGKVSETRLALARKGRIHLHEKANNALHVTLVRPGDKIASYKESTYKIARPGFVYLIRSASGYYKIGRTKNPDDRIATFSVKLPFEVEYEHLIETTDMYQLEKDLHARFADRRVNGEWFDLTDDDVAYVKSLGVGQ